MLTIAHATGRTRQIVHLDLRLDDTASPYDYNVWLDDKPVAGYRAVVSTSGATIADLVTGMRAALQSAGCIERCLVDTYKACEQGALPSHDAIKVTARLLEAMRVFNQMQI